MTAKRKMTPKERVKRKYPSAHAVLTAMWGWRIYIDSYTPKLLTGVVATHKTEARAWSAAARRLK